MLRFVLAETFTELIYVSPFCLEGVIYERYPVCMAVMLAKTYEAFKDAGALDEKAYDSALVCVKAGARKRAKRKGIMPRTLSREGIIGEEIHRQAARSQFSRERSSILANSRSLPVTSV